MVEAGVGLLPMTTGPWVEVIRNLYGLQGGPTTGELEQMLGALLREIARLSWRAAELGWRVLEKIYRHYPLPASGGGGFVLGWKFGEDHQKLVRGEVATTAEIFWRHPLMLPIMGGMIFAHLDLIGKTTPPIYTPDGFLEWLTKLALSGMGALTGLFASWAKTAFLEG